jgi:hypothetical protein
VGPHSYALEKLASAAHTLAVGPGDVRSRLVNVLSDIHGLSERHFPSVLREDWHWVKEQLSRFPPSSDWQGASQLRKIRNSTGVKIAEKLMYIYHCLEPFAEQECQGASKR